VCHSDLHQADGEWDDPGPLVLGHEGSGVVEALGPGVGGLSAGQQVVLNWFYPCLRCAACQAGKQWLCTGSHALQHRQPDGSTRLRRADGSEVLAFLALGTFAEQVVVPEQAAVPIPDQVPAEVAALIGCCVSTGVGAVLKTAELPLGASACVFGLGGVGLSVVMGCALAGAGRLVAVDRIPAKLELAEELGATETVLAGDPEETVKAVRQATKGGVDFAFEAIGLQVTIEEAMRVLRPGGTAVLVGMTPLGIRASFDAFRFVDHSHRLLGSNYGFSVPALDFPRLAQLYLAGRLPIDRLIDGRISLEGINDAFTAMRRGEGLRKVVVP
jgi:S-(hydroxymethyl)glutathione dehydrogenase/alcohol dehydrogenase